MTIVDGAAAGVAELENETLQVLRRSVVDDVHAHGLGRLAGGEGQRAGDIAKVVEVVGTVVGQTVLGRRVVHAHDIA